MFLRLPLIIVTVCSIACGSGSPTSPSPNTPAPSPQPTTFTVSGTVTESSPTTGTRLANARVEVGDGPHAGKFSMSDGSGNYAIVGVAGGFTLRTTLDGYETDSRGLDVTSNRTIAIPLRPIFRMLDETLTGTLSGGDTPTCSDGVFDKPCRRTTLDIHHNGNLTARLDWDNSTDLDLTLWRGSSLIASSRSASTRTEGISSAVSAGSYELRVTYYTGSNITGYTLRVQRPN